jgi:hypothetical protein
VSFSCPVLWRCHIFLSIYSSSRPCRIARFARYFGRLGVPNLNVDGVIERLRADAAAKTKTD